MLSSIIKFFFGVKASKVYRLGGLPSLSHYLLTALRGQPLYQIKGLWLRHQTSDLPMYREVIGDEEYKFATNTPEHIKTIVDLGANAGYASVFFARSFPNARIIAIEAESENFQLLKKNTAQYPNVECAHLAVWNQNEMISLAGEDTCAYQVDAERKSNKRTVQAMTVDSLLERFEIQSIDFLKVDVEGAEKEIFEASTPWLARVSALSIELHDRFKKGCSRAFYNAVNDRFDHEWHRGENVFVSKKEVDVTSWQD